MQCVYLNKALPEGQFGVGRFGGRTKMYVHYFKPYGTNAGVVGTPTSHQLAAAPLIKMSLCQITVSSLGLPP